MTIRHVVSWKLAETDPALRAQHAAEIKTALEALGGQVEGMTAINVGINAAGPVSNWNLVLIADYDDEAALERYQVHPGHVAAAAVIRGYVSERSCVDFELAGN